MNKCSYVSIYNYITLYIKINTPVNPEGEEE